MAIVGDPVDSGIVASYSRPGGNITGSSFFFPEINAKRLELMKSLVPGLNRAGVLMNPDNLAMTSVLRAMDEVAKAINVKLQHVEVRRLDALDSAFAQRQIANPSTYAHRRRAIHRKRETHCRACDKKSPAGRGIQGI